MNKILAIKGDKNRGNEVIALLQMLGGEAIAAKGNDETVIYGISENSIIDIRLSYEKRIDNYTIFTLDEFYARFPFKVRYFVFAGNCTYAVDIRQMHWNAKTQEVEYMVKPWADNLWYTANKLTKYVMPKFNVGETVYNKHTRKFGEIVKYQWQKDEYIYLIHHLMEDAWYLERQLTKDVESVDNENKMKNVLAELLEHIKTTSKDDLEKEFEELKEWSNVGPTVEEFMTFCECVNKKPKYPTTYEECCKVLKKNPDIKPEVRMVSPEESLLFSKLIMLKRCRDAYWKIYGEKKGLDKPWDSTYGCGEWGYWIGYSINENKIYLQDSRILVNCVLIFPTEEMRDAFNVNFKDLIEKCKELL
jgi:hypothetical protein